MANKVTEKYFTHENFALRAKSVLIEVVKETDFSVGKEIFRGQILDRNKVGSVIYSGIYKQKPAALKLQGLKPATEEADLIKAFEKQNKSKLVRLPKIYLSRRWNKTRGYGFMISEFVAGNKIYGCPLATKIDMRQFVKFYNEFKKNSLKKPFVISEKKTSLDFTLARVEKWVEICEHKKYLNQKKCGTYLAEYGKMAEKYLPRQEMVFFHGHLSPDDILVTPEGQYVLLSNLFWRWQPEWYDLAFNVYTRLQQLRDKKITIVKAKKYIDDWIKTYKTIPQVKKDKYFDRKILIMLLERSLGAILIDVGGNELLYKDKTKFNYFVKLHEQLFKFLYKKLINYNI